MHNTLTNITRFIILYNKNKQWQIFYFEVIVDILYDLFTKNNYNSAYAIYLAIKYIEAF